MILSKDIKRCKYIENKDAENIEEITEHTQNTWQKNRSKNEKFEDTKIGKKAENIIERYIKDNFPQLNYVSYDDFREDKFEKHAPFDGLLYKKEDVSEEKLKKVIKKINEDVKNNKFGKISNETKKFTNDNNIKIVEIKSTRISARHLNDKKEVNFEKILDDDFLTYPKYLREDKYGFLTEKKYYEFCKKKNSNYNVKEELENMADIYIRIYMNDEKKEGYIVGYVDKENFFKNKKLKKMRKPNKSEKAVYWATNLKKGFPIEDLISIFS
jgi:hypothetical protein